MGNLKPTLAVVPQRETRSIVRARATEMHNGSDVLPLISGVILPPRRYGREEGVIKKTLRAAKDSPDKNDLYFVVTAAGNAHIFKAAKVVGVKVEVRKLDGNKFGVLVKKPV